MKPVSQIKVQKSVLYTALMKTSRTRIEPGMCRALNLPIAYSCFVFSLSGHREISVCTTDRDMYTDVTIPLLQRSGRFQDFALHAYELTCMIRQLEDQELCIVLHPEHAVFRHSFGSFTLPLVHESLDMFFKDRLEMILHRKTDFSLNFQASFFHTMLDRLYHYTDFNGLHHVLNGINIHRSAGQIHFVASEGHRLMRITKDDTENTLPYSILIPHKAITILRRTLPRTGSLSLEYSICKDGYDESPKYMIRTENFTFYFSPTEGKFPNFNNVIPQISPHVVVLDRMMFAKALERARMFTGIGGKLAVKVKDGNMHLMANDKDFGIQSVETLPVEHTGKPFHFGLNTKHVIEILHSLYCRKVSIQAGAPDRAILVTPDTQPSDCHITTIFMPCLTDEDFEELYEKGTYYL